jgi:hypothetical protein
VLERKSRRPKRTSATQCWTITNNANASAWKMPKREAAVRSMWTHALLWIATWCSPVMKKLHASLSVRSRCLHGDHFVASSRLLDSRATESEARRLLVDELRTDTAILFHALSEEAALSALEGRTRQFIIVHADNVVSMLRDAVRTRRVLVTAEACERATLRTTASFVAHAIQRLAHSQDLMLTELAELLKRAAISMVSFSQLRHYFQTSAFILSESRARAEITQTEADERHAMLDNYQQRQRISVEDAEAGSRSQIDVDARSALDRDVVLPCHEEAARIVIRAKQMSARRSLRCIEQVARLTATESEARRLLLDELRTNTAILFHALSEEAALCAREERTRQFIIVHADKVMSMLRDAARTRRVLVTAEASDRAALRTTATFVAHAIQRLSQSQDLMLTELAELLKRAAISMVSFSQLRHYFQTSAFILSESRARAEITQTEADERLTMLDNYQQHRRIGVEGAEAGSRCQIDVDARVALDRDVVLPCQQEAARIVIHTKQMSARRSLRRIEQVARLMATESEARRLLEDELRTDTAILFHALSEEAALCAREERTRQFITVHADKVMSMLRDAARTRRVLVTAEASDRAALRTTASFVAHAIQRLSQSQDLMLTELAELLRRAAISMVSFSQLRHYFQTSAFILSESGAREQIASDLHIHTVNVLDSAERSARCALIAETEAAHNMVYQRAECSAASVEEALQRKWASQHATFTLHYAIPLEFAEGAKRIELACDCVAQRNAILAQRQVAWIQQDEAQSRLSLTAEFTDSISTLTARLNARLRVVSTEERDRHALIREASAAIALHGAIAQRRIHVLLAEAAERNVLSRQHACIAQLLEARSFAQRLLMLQHVETIKRARLAMKASGTLLDLLNVSRVVQNEHTSRLAVEHRARSFHFERFQQAEELARAVVVEGAVQNHRDLGQQRQRAELQLRETLQRRRLTTAAVHIATQVMTVESDEAISRLRFAVSQAKERELLASSLRFTRLFADESELRFAVVLQEQAAATSLFHTLETEKNITTSENAQRRAVIFVAYEAGDVLREMTLARLRSLIAEQRERMELRATFAFVTHSVMTSASHNELFLAEHADVVLRSTIAVRALAQVSLWHALTTTAVNEAAARATAQEERVVQAMRTLVLIESSARHGIVAEATQSSAMIMDAARFQTVSLREQQRRSLVVMTAHVRLGGVIPLQFAEGSQRISIREDEASQRARFTAAHRVARLATQETQGRLSISLRQQSNATTLFNLLAGETTVVIGESRERQAMEATATQVGEFTGLWIRDRVTVLASEAASRRSLQRDVTESLLLATEAADRRRLFASQSSAYLRLRQLQSRYTALYLSLASNAAYWHAIGKPEFTQREKLLHRVFNRSVAGSHAALLAGLKVQTDEAAARYGVKLAFETEVARLRAVEFVERRKIDPSTVVSSILLQVPAAPSAMKSPDGSPEVKYARRDTLRPHEVGSGPLANIPMEMLGSASTSASSHSTIEDPTSPGSALMHVNGTFTGPTRGEYRFPASDSVDVDRHLPSSSGSGSPRGDKPGSARRHSASDELVPVVGPAGSQKSSAASAKWTVRHSRLATGHLDTSPRSAQVVLNGNPLVPAVSSSTPERSDESSTSSQSNSLGFGLPPLSPSSAAPQRPPRARSLPTTSTRRGGVYVPVSHADAGGGDAAIDDMPEMTMSMTPSCAGSGQRRPMSAISNDEIGALRSTEVPWGDLPATIEEMRQPGYLPPTPPFERRISDSAIDRLLEATPHAFSPTTSRAASPSMRAHGRAPQPLPGAARTSRSRVDVPLGSPSVSMMRLREWSPRATAFDDSTEGSHGENNSDASTSQQPLPASAQQLPSAKSGTQQHHGSNTARGHAWNAIGATPNLSSVKGAETDALLTEDQRRRVRAAEAAWQEELTRLDGGDQLSDSAVNSQNLQSLLIDDSQSHDARATDSASDHYRGVGGVVTSPSTVLGGTGSSATAAPG